MKEMSSDKLGSWKRAVVTSDGVWHTRGHFSKNDSFIIKIYLTGGLLWYGHKCMRGKDGVLEDELFEGMAKSMERSATRRQGMRALKGRLFGRMQIRVLPWQ